MAKSTSGTFHVQPVNRIAIVTPKKELRRRKRAIGRTPRCPKCGAQMEGWNWRIDDALYYFWSCTRRECSPRAYDVAEQPVQPCGHPMSAIVGGGEGTHYCAMCESEAR